MRGRGRAGGVCTEPRGRRIAGTCVCARSLLRVPRPACLMGMMRFRRDQQPQSTAGGPHDHPQAQMFTPPMLQPELHPESLQSVLSPMW